MKLPKRGERGFTLIELLIVVAILGVLAAVVIPNVQRFIGAGTEEAKDTELATIQAAVSAMMVDNEIGTLPPGTFPAIDEATATSTMGDDPNTPAVVEPGFPAPNATCAAAAEKVYDPDGILYVDGTDPLGDKDGYILFGHDITAGDNQPPTAGAAPLVNYVAQPSTAYLYWVNASGTVFQGGEAP